jgi:hypothetical protein
MLLHETVASNSKPIENLEKKLGKKYIFCSQPNIDTFVETQHHGVFCQLYYTNCMIYSYTVYYYTV